MIAILPPRITPAKFVDKWRPVALSERAAAQSHFNDLCDLVGHPRPLEVDPTGEWFTFEKGVKKVGGGSGFADVWKRGSFAWEYKKKHLNLDSALKQLSQYALALENPPLQIVCDTDRFRIVTAYTNSVPCSYDISLDELLDTKKRGILETAFHHPKKLKPGADRADLTKTAADKFSTLTQRLQAKDHSPDDVAHFVNRLVFLFFAEDVGILDEGFFRKAISGLSKKPSDAKGLLTDLFLTLKTGGRFGLDILPWINGGLFDDREALPLDEHEIGLLKAASSQDWAHIDPTIFGALFERFLDPDKRAQIGAHYTDAGKIGQIVEPVILRPLREEWQAARSDIEALVKKASAKGAKSKDWQRAEERRSAFLERLRTLSILDPACGSGNFLYLALHGVKDLEHVANQECEAMGLPLRMPMVGPEILRGIEINPLAAELARTTIWIGDIQWAIQNGIRSRPEPILRRLDMIECRDALLNADGNESIWPNAEFIIGNPPFLGVKKMISSLGEAYTENIRRTYKGRVSPFSDLVCWWFLKSTEQIESGRSKRAGLVATNSVRGGKNRLVLDRITKSGRIFDAHADQPWVLDGAAVRVSIVCFDFDKSGLCSLNGQPVQSISPDLTAGEAASGEITQVVSLKENADISFQGLILRGSFDINGSIARSFLTEPTNPNGRPNADVIFPIINGQDLVQNNRDQWVINCDGMDFKQASFYQKPFEFLKGKTKNERATAREEDARVFWWRLWRQRLGLQNKLKAVERYIATPTLSKHRIFVWVDARVLPNHQVIAIVSESDETFGILQSRFHREWALRLGTSLEDRPRYTPTTTFETFPFPEKMINQHYAPARNNDYRLQDVARAAIDLHTLRERWLRPLDLIRSEPEVVSGYPDRTLPLNAACATKLKTRTLTNLYNERPTWLDDAHRELDAAVAAAYGWPEDISTEDALAALLELNRERAAAQGKA